MLNGLGLFCDCDQVCEVANNVFKCRQDQEPETNKWHVAGAVHETVVANLHKSFWQHMLKETS